MLVSNLAFANGDGYLSTTQGVTTVAEWLVGIFNLIGITLSFLGLYGFYKHSSDPRTYSISYCLGNIIAGALLLISSTTYMWTVNSAAPVSWATDSSMLAVGSKINDDINQAKQGFLGKYLPEGSVKTLMGFVYLVGLISYLRGIYLLKNTGSVDNSQSGGFYKALWHIVGGAATMNILQVGCFLSWLLGISMICSG